MFVVTNCDRNAKQILTQFFRELTEKRTRPVRYYNTTRRRDGTNIVAVKDQ